MSPINKFTTKIIPLVSVLLLTSCSQPPVVPLDDYSFTQPKKTIHIAGSGDTLYSIAFLAGLDYKEVAAWNNISDSYLIKRGQRISLVRPKNFNHQINSQDIVKPIKTEASTVEIKQPETQIVKVNPQPSISEPAPSNKNFTPFDNSWLWPISAMNIVNYKKSNQNSGLDIISKHGVTVKAAAAGKVVYAGNSLKGYGNLIIIKHNDTYLSAYAHNQSINVREGDDISQSQKIAEVGSSDAKQAKLHFEIRKNGKPINPLGLLPKKVG